MRVAILPGAGSDGGPWSAVAEQLDAEIVELPDSEDVARMAQLVGEKLGAGEEIVLVGASLGAMVALQLAQRRTIAGLVLMAAGFGVHVAPEVLDRFDDAAPDLLERVAAGGLGRREPELVRARLDDFERRGVDVLARHLRALAAYRPTAPTTVIPTVVLHGELDRAVPLADHLELTIQTNGLLRPLRGVGHSLYLEAPDEVVRWTRYVVEEAAR